MISLHGSIIELPFIFIADGIILRGFEKNEFQFPSESGVEAEPEFWIRICLDPVILVGSVSGLGSGSGYLEVSYPESKFPESLL